MKTYIGTAFLPVHQEGETGLVVVMTPSGKIMKREPIRPSYVPDMAEDGYAVDLMQRMFPVSGTIISDMVTFDSKSFGGPVAANKGRVKMWLVDVEGELS